MPAVKILPRVADAPVRFDPVVGELEGDPLVGRHAAVEGNGHLGGFEIDEVQGIDPLLHLRLQPLGVEIGGRIAAAGFLHLQALALALGKTGLLLRHPPRLASDRAVPCPPPGDR